MVCCKDKAEYQFKVVKHFKRMMKETVQWCSTCQRRYVSIEMKKQVMRFDNTPSTMSFNDDDNNNEKTNVFPV